MKKFYLLLIVTMCVGGLQAQERQLLKANVPFSFMAGDNSFPAGSYTVYLLSPNNLLRVQSLDRGPSAVVHGLPSEMRSEGPAELVFDRIDGKLFLTEIHGYSNREERTLPLGKFALELEAKRHTGPRVDGVVSVTAH